MATNVRNGALVLMESGSIVVTLSGLLQRARLVPISTEDELASVRFDKVLLRIAGMDPTSEINVHHPFDEVFALRLIECANRIVVVADSTMWTVGGWAGVAGSDDRRPCARRPATAAAQRSR